jgi:hypothetical protein
MFNLILSIVFTNNIVELCGYSFIIEALLWNDFDFLIWYLFEGLVSTLCWFPNFSSDLFESSILEGIFEQKHGSGTKV